jgi:hypothetical protein
MHLAALLSQACIGWGQFFKGLCSTKFQKEEPVTQGAFKQIQWTCEIVDFKAEHWKL